MTATGRIFDVQRCSLHDGPGIRTTVFLKGCPLRCRWCHNPESQAPGPELSFDAERCVGCAACVGVCAPGNHRVDAGGHAIDRDGCTACGACTRACAQGALRLIGRDATADELVAVAERDRAYVQRSGGGLTISGGEPLAQPEFSQALGALARDRGIHVAVETSGYAAPSAVERLLPVVDLWLVDWKCSDPDRHRALTGVGNAPIRATLGQLSRAGAAIVLRCPLIPGLNDDDGHLDGIAGLARTLPGLRRVELLGYHDLGAAKAGRLGRSAGCPQPSTTPETLRAWTERLAQRGCLAQAG